MPLALFLAPSGSCQRATLRQPPRVPQRQRERVDDARAPVKAAVAAQGIVSRCVSAVNTGADMPQVRECEQALNVWSTERHGVAANMHAQFRSIGGLENVEDVLAEERITAGQLHNRHASVGPLAKYDSPNPQPIARPAGRHVVTTGMRSGDTRGNSHTSSSTSTISGA